MPRYPYGGGYGPQYMPMQQSVPLAPILNPPVREKKTIKLEQGGADAFVEASIVTNSNKMTGQGLLIHEVDFMPKAATPEVDGCLTLQMSTKSAGAAQLASDDKSLVDEWEINTRLTTSGMVRNVFPHTVYREYLIFAGTLYFNVDSSDGGTTTVYVHLWCEDVFVQNPEKLRRGWF